MNPIFPAKLFTADPAGRLTNNPLNASQDMLPQSGQRSDLYGGQQLSYTSTGLQPSPQPQQRVILRPGSQYTGGGSMNAAGHPGLIAPREVLEQIAAHPGTSLPMGSQGAPPQGKRRGTDTSLSGSRQRFGGC
jgi:hypothetical protein